jgi:signal transduction histidine kinase
MSKETPRHSLRTKIIAWSFVPTVIILSAVAWFTFYSYQRVIGDLALERDKELIRSKAGQVTQAIGNLVNLPLVPIVLEIDLDHSAPIEERGRKILIEAPHLDIFDGGTYFLNQQGTIVVAGPDRPELLSQDWSGSDQFRYIKEFPGEVAFTDIESIGPGGEEILCSALSMLDQEMGFAGAGYYCFLIHSASPNAFYNSLNRLDLGQNISLLDRNQHTIYSSDLSRIHGELSRDYHIQPPIDGQAVAGRFDVGSEDLVISYAPIFAASEDPGIHLTLLKEQEWTEIMRPSLAYRQLLIVLLALGIIVPVIVTAIGVRYITNPIKKLTQVATEVAAGQFDQTISVRTGDEIGALAEQFNLMSSRLDESYSLLENRVADRTKELATMNSIASVASRSLNVQEILEDALNETMEMMNIDTGAAFRFESDQGEMALMANRGFEQTVAIDLGSLYSTESEAKPAGIQQETTALGIGELREGDLKDRFRQHNIQSLAIVPLTSKERLMGLFILGRIHQNSFSQEEFSLFRSIGQQVGVAVENAHLYEQARQVAITEERHRLARELHDAVTQTLFSANLIADVLPRIWKRNPEEGSQSLEELRQLTRSALAEMRTMLLEMRPDSLERYDVKTLLTHLTDALIGRTCIAGNLRGLRPGIRGEDCFLPNRSGSN